MIARKTTIIGMALVAFHLVLLGGKGELSYPRRARTSEHQ